MSSLSTRCLRAERGIDVADLLHQSLGLGYTLEAVALVELGSPLVQRIDDDEAGCDKSSRLDRALERLGQQGTAKAPYRAGTR